jgi:hypothetical protein
VCAELGTRASSVGGALRHDTRTISTLYS